MPFCSTLFTIIFGNLAKIESDGVPYAIFSFTALVPWTFFSNSVSEGAGSLIQNSNMISKIYFPRIILPLAAVAAKLLDFSIAMLVLVALLFWYQINPGWDVAVMPLLILLMVISASAIGIWLTAMAIQFRDIKYGISFLLQLLMYTTNDLASLSCISA